MPEFPALLSAGVSRDGQNPASRIVERANEVDGSDNASVLVITGKNGWGGQGRVSQNTGQSAHKDSASETINGGVEKSPLELMGEARTPEELLEAISGLEGLQGSKLYYPRSELLSIARDIFEGNEVLFRATSTGGFRKAVERVGCRFYPGNMVKGGHEEVFVGAHFLGDELDKLYEMIDRFGPIPRSDGKPISTEELKRTAQYIVKDGIRSDIATRTHGFRKALIEMSESVT